ncbi:MAG: TMEM175 family protein [Ktedonobacteraceae bacterium]
MKEFKEVEHRERTDELKETGRIEAFSDGVFAVAITLLVLNIQAPPPHDPLLQDGKLLSFLGSLAPTYLAFVTSFATIGVMWVNHHKLYTHIKRADNTLLLLNLLLLLVIVFIPFPTALMAGYILQPDYHVAAILYCVTFLLMAFCFNVLWWYASYKNRLIDPNSSEREVSAITKQYRYGPLFYVFTTALAFFYPPASIGADLLLTLFFAVPGRTRPE